MSRGRLLCLEQRFGGISNGRLRMVREHVAVACTAWCGGAPVRHDRSMGEGPGAYFISSTDGLQPVPEARSPWAADMLHGRLLAGLAARAVEGGGHDAELRVVRLTVDMFRSPPMSALHV